MAEDRSWMYTGRQSRKKFTPEWLENTTEFVERAFRILPPGRQAVLCPCARCQFRLYRPKDEIQLHLFKNGFAPGYTVWVYHGESHNPQPAKPKPSDDHPEDNGGLNGKKDGAGGDEPASKPQGTKKWACARGKPPKKDQLWARAVAQGEGGPATTAEDRSWMYTGRQSRQSITPEWAEKTTEFVERAFRGVPPEFGMLCPCARCRNRNRLPRTKFDMTMDLGRNGFMPGYTVWVHHGEGPNPQPAKPSDDRGRKDGRAGGGEQVSKPQETKEWEISHLEAYARGRLPKGTSQMEWSYQKYLWEQKKAKLQQQQQQSEPKAKRLLTFAEVEGSNVSLPDPELEDTATATADGTPVANPPTADDPVANPATTADPRGVQIPAGPTARPKRKAGPPGWHSGSDWVH
ncbi:uncharacterized protein [Aegilops tauschii subsp. strangulata]|uniref:uncharacterized protein isoform X1 n=1 Tax=Aegilops tauschii subsp. strangulata TaxID=200361 RepID=UPI001ABCE915|nr:uncharacterized protein LOC109780765 [Aegilops tauschii subsp. strangulata]